MLAYQTETIYQTINLFKGIVDMYGRLYNSFWRYGSDQRMGTDKSTSYSYIGLIQKKCDIMTAHAAVVP